MVRWSCRAKSWERHRTYRLSYVIIKIYVFGPHPGPQSVGRMKASRAGQSGLAYTGTTSSFTHIPMCPRKLTPLLVTSSTPNSHYHRGQSWKHEQPAVAMHWRVFFLLYKQIVVVDDDARQQDPNVLTGKGMGCR